MLPVVYGENMFDDFLENGFFGSHNPLFGNWVYITPGKNMALPMKKFWILSVFILLVRQA